MPEYRPRDAHEVEAKLTDREREMIRFAVAEAVALIRSSSPEQPQLPPVAPVVRRLNVNSAHGRLTKSEGRVLELLLAGHSNKTAAEVLNISPRTVEVHRRKAMERLGVKQLTEVWMLAYAREVARREGPQPA